MRPVRSARSYLGNQVSSSELQLSTKSSDPQFNGLSIDPVRIDIIDNDPPRAQIKLVSDSTEEAKPGRFQIQLASPAPDSAGSNGILVNYQITTISLDPGLGYTTTPSETIGKITQSPGTVSGQVRIAPGQSRSDLIVVPIDDFVADSPNKSFTVQLVAGDGYTLSNDSASNSASIQIINNETAGIALLTSGERILIKETGESASYQLALLTQPKDDVTITISESIPAGGSRQLGTGTPYSQTITFTPSDWYVARQIAVQAFDDGQIEDGDGANQFTGIHGAELSYSFSSNDPDYDSSGKSSDHFTQLVQAVDVLDYELPDTTADALQASLTSLQDGIDSLSLPIVGSLDGKAGDGLRKFITTLVNSVRQIGTPTPSKLSKLLSQQIANALGIPESAVAVSLKMQGVEAIVVSFSFADSYDIFSIPLAADLGMPGLGFQSEGSLDAEFSYAAGLELVFSRSGDVYLNTSIDKDGAQNTYLNAAFKSSLSPDFKLTGGLGFLQLDAVNQVSENENVGADTGINVSFDLDLGGDAGSDGKLTLDELISSDLEKVVQYELEGNAAMSFGVTTSLSGSAAIPSFSFDLASLLPLFDYSNKAESSDPQNATSFYFDNIRLDLGTYITQMLGPIVDGLDTILNPLYPIVDALYSDTQIFSTLGIEGSFDGDGDGHVSAIDLASWYASFYDSIANTSQSGALKDAIDKTIEFLEVVKGVMDLVRDLEDMKEEGNFYVDYGNYVLPTFSAADPSGNTEDVDTDNEESSLNPDTKTQANKGGQSSDGKTSSKFAEIMDQLRDLGFAIPLIDDPKNAIKLLLGQNVDLFTWTMPEMGMSSEVEESFPIYPGIEGVIEGGFGVDANLGFGFDTYGLNQWKQGGFKASDAWKVFDGFYVADWKGDEDVAEFSMSANMGAGLGLSALVVRSEITGGLEAKASFDLLDEGEVAGTSDGKIRGTEISSRISNPLELFELVGSLSAYLESEVAVGVDMGFYSIWDTVWKERLATIPLFEFGVGGSYGSGTVSNGYLQGTTVFWDGNQNARIDPYEPSTITGDDSHYNLRIEHRSFDLNRNGTIDAEEGHLVAFGGADSVTGLPLEVPFLAPLGQMITPLTTLHTIALAEGFDGVSAAAWIDQAFGLNGFDYLRRDPLLDLKQADASASVASIDPLTTYIAHIKLHFSWDVLAYSLQQLLSEQYPESIETELALITAHSQELLASPNESPINERLATAALQAINRLSPHPSSDIAPLASLAAGLATNASWDLCQQLDMLFASAQEGDISLAESLKAINQLKSDAFTHYRTATDSISQGLYRISEPEVLERTVQQRLSAIYSSFIMDHPLQSGSEDGANGLIRLLDNKTWLLAETARLSSTPFTAIQSLAQAGITLSDRQLDFELRLNQNDDASSVAGQPGNPRILVNLESFEMTQESEKPAFTYYSGTNLTPTPFLYDGNSKTGARLFNLGSGLSPVMELNYQDGRRGDGEPEPGLIRNLGAVAALEQSHRLVSTVGSQLITIAAGDQGDRREAAVFVTTELIRRAASSNLIGYLILRENEVWDASSISLGELQERLQILGASLEDGDLPQLGNAMQARRELQLTSGDQLVFLEVMDSTLNDLENADASIASLADRIVILEADGAASTNSLLLHSSTSGLQLQVDLSTDEPGLGSFLARQQSQAALLDFSGLGDRSVQGTLEISREAAYDTIAGFYQVLDVDGTVSVGIDPISGVERFLRPSDGEAYRIAALAEDNVVGALGGLSSENLKLISRNLSIRADSLLAPFAIVNTGEATHTYFAFRDANRDLIEHFQTNGDNVFMLEDRDGGGDRDFDDLLIAFNPTGVL